MFCSMQLHRFSRKQCLKRAESWLDMFQRTMVHYTNAKHSSSGSSHQFCWHDTSTSGSGIIGKLHIYIPPQIFIRLLPLCHITWGDTPECSPLVYYCEAPVHYPFLRQSPCSKSGLNWLQCQLLSPSRTEFLKHLLDSLQSGIFWIQQ